MTEQTQTHEVTMIPINDLKVTKVNMRHGEKKPDVSDLVPSIKAHGILLPLIVRPNCDGFDIIAGRRRYLAGEEAGMFEFPCIVRQEGDDADALEISLLENLHRVDPDPLTQFETFAALFDYGRSVEDIAAVFGLGVGTINKRLALGKVNPRIRALYRKGEIADGELQTFTMASDRQQKDWLKLYADENEREPRHRMLHSWLFESGKYSVSVALFDPEAAKGGIVDSLFEEDRLFSDGAEFWRLQNAAISARAGAYKERGWDVEIMERGHGFYDWEYRKTAKTKGGRVYIRTHHDGSVEFHEGYITEKEAKRQEKEAEGKTEDDTQEDAKPERVELTYALQSYVALHRAAAVRVELSKKPAIALRLMVASAIGGNNNWSVNADQDRGYTEAAQEAYFNSPVLAAHRMALVKARGLLGWEPGRSLIGPVYDKETTTAEAFAALMTLTDKKVMEITAVVMADTLEHGSGIVEALGSILEVDMADHWTPDDAFLDLVRDKDALRGMVKETAGKAVADANATATGKVLKTIIKDCLTGENSRKKVEGWLPKYMKFPFAAYRTTEGTGITKAWKAVARHFKNGRK